MAAHDRSKLRNAEYVAMYCPRLARGAAKYSPTTAPIVASVAASRSAVKTYGRALGMRSLRKTCASDAASERRSSSGRGIDVGEAADRVDHHREEAQGRGDHRLGQLLVEAEPVVEQRREGEDRHRARGDRERHQRVLHRPVARGDRPDRRSRRVDADDHPADDLEERVARRRRTARAGTSATRPRSRSGSAG